MGFSHVRERERESTIREEERNSGEENRGCVQSKVVIPCVILGNGHSQICRHRVFKIQKSIQMFQKCQVLLLKLKNNESTRFLTNFNDVNVTGDD